MTVQDIATDTTPAATETDNERPPAGTVWVAAGELRAALAAVRHFTADRDDNPILAGVHLEAGNGHLAAMATNRYVLARAARAAEGDMSRLLLVRSGADVLFDLVDPERTDHRARVSLAVNSAGRTMTVTLDKVVMVLPIKYPEFGVAKFRELLDPAGYGEPTDGRVALRPGMLGVVRDALADTAYSHEPVRLYVRAADKPVRVECGDWLVVLLMPNRVREGLDPAVPYALPDHPAELPTDEAPLGTDWPETERAATAAAMWAHFAGAAIRGQRAWFDRPLLKVPPRGERTPEQERILRGDNAELTAVAYAAGLARVLREFAAVAPGPADAVARELWADFEHGDNLAEWPWEWLQEARIPTPAQADMATSPTASEETAARLGEQIRKGFNAEA
ncbi:hypothetical protein [Actinoplanes sp. URMC 104]|uniref:hypothetical protein n=1 Tax=Actinoplanes sp. URMC 104 TaxID=3423409 RepID=UPI003F1C2672